MFQDRWYQAEAVQSVWDYFNAGNVGNPVLALPTGTGKSVVIARLLYTVYQAYPMQRVLMLVDSKELIQQNYEKLLSLWPFAPAGVYSAGLKQRDIGKAITFAGIQSVWKLAALFGHIDLVIIDEVHMVPPAQMGMYRTFIAALLAINPYLKLIGLTATKYRLGQGLITDSIEVKGEELKPLFTDICYDITGVEDFNRLIAEGFLTPLRAPVMKPLLEADGIHMRGGEFIESELQTWVDQHDELTYQALVEAKRIADEENRQSWLLFATGNNHADTIGHMLDELGVSNGVVHTGRSDRDAVIKAGKAGELTATVNNNVLTKGFDNPLIDLIVVLRQTASPVLWVQLLGRGTRPLYGPGGDATGYDLETLGGRLAAIRDGGKLNCKVLDFAGNTARLGPINDPVVPRRKGKGGGDAPVKECWQCNEWIHASLRFCNWCGAEFKFETKLTATASSHEIVRGDDPVVETLSVTHVSINEHRKYTRAGEPPKPPCVRLTYYCGLHAQYSDFIMPEHADFARRKSAKLWSEMGGGELPATTAEALQKANFVLNMPTHLSIWTNTKPAQILSRCYDGTAFGTQEATVAPSVDVVKVTAPLAQVADYGGDDLDDDIPF